MTDAPDRPLPDEPPPDDFHWTAEPEDPDVAGMPGEYVNAPAEDVPGVRRSEETSFDQESKN